MLFSGPWQNVLQIVIENLPTVIEDNVIFIKQSCQPHPVVTKVPQGTCICRPIILPVRPITKRQLETFKIRHSLCSVSVTVGFDFQSFCQEYMQILPRKL